jgi:hypothetical protein
MPCRVVPIGQQRAAADAGPRATVCRCLPKRPNDAWVPHASAGSWCLCVVSVGWRLGLAVWRVWGPARRGLGPCCKVRVGAGGGRRPGTTPAAQLARHGGGAVETGRKVA